MKLRKVGEAYSSLNSESTLFGPLLKHLMFSAFYYSVFASLFYLPLLVIELLES